MSAVLRSCVEEAIIVRHGEVERIDAAKIVSVDKMLACDHRRLRSSEDSSRKSS